VSEPYSCLKIGSDRGSAEMPGPFFVRRHARSAVIVITVARSRVRLQPDPTMSA